ncbi:hypothetical protein V7193_16720, partial [Bacillus velezensis]
IYAGGESERVLAEVKKILPVTPKIV